MALMRSHHPLVIALLFFVPFAHASRSGLNNVPNADISLPHTGVIQVYSAFGEDRKPSFLSGVRLGVALFGEKIEAGFDTRWKPGKSVPVFFNAKWASHWNKSLPVLGVGVASFAPRSADRRRLGQPQTYGVLTYDAQWARLHAGYAVQRRNNAAFFGVDRSWQIFERKLMFRSDIIQIQDQAQWLASVGFTYKLTKALGVELWQSKPAERGRSYTTLKFGWSFNY
jgi:hypothetical protein